MTFTAGDFTASDLHSEVLAKIDTLVVDPTQKHLLKETSIFNSLASYPVFRAQTPEQVAFFSDAKRCASLKLSFLLDGDTTAPAAAGTADFCDPDGPQIGSDSVTYAKPGGKEKTFKVLTDTCTGLYGYAEKVAYAFMSKRALLVDQLEKDAITFLTTSVDDLAAAGVSVPKGGVTTTNWNIGAITDTDEARLAAVKDLAHIGHFAMDQRMIAPALVMGNRFRYEDKVFNATQGGGVADARSLLTDLPVIRDVFNLDSVTTTQDILLVDRATMGYVNYTWSQSTAAPSSRIELNRPVQFYINDPVLRVWDPVSNSVVPYKWDITMVEKCNTYNQFAMIYTVTGRGGWLRAPKDVTNKPTIAQIKFADNP